MNYRVITADLTPQQYQQDADHLILGSLIVLAVCVLIALLIAVAIFGGAEGRAAKRAQAALRAADYRRYALEQHWVDTDEWPLTHYDVYPTAWELTQDLARLKAMGYNVEWQEHLEDGVAVTYSLTPAYKESRNARKRRPRQQEEGEGAYLS
jgi:hypothetical protein